MSHHAHICILHDMGQLLAPDAAVICFAVESHQEPYMRATHSYPAQLQLQQQRTDCMPHQHCQHALHLLVVPVCSCCLWLSTEQCALLQAASVVAPIWAVKLQERPAHVTISTAKGVRPKQAGDLVRKVQQGHIYGIVQEHCYTHLRYSGCILQACDIHA